MPVNDGVPVWDTHGKVNLDIGGGRFGVWLGVICKSKGSKLKGSGGRTKVDERFFAWNVTGTRLIDDNKHAGDDVKAEIPEADGGRGAETYQSQDGQEKERELWHEILHNNTDSGGWTEAVG